MSLSLQAQIDLRTLVLEVFGSNGFTSKNPKAVARLQDEAHYTAEDYRQWAEDSRIENARDPGPNDPVMIAARLAKLSLVVADCCKHIGDLLQPKIALDTPAINERTRR